jgi:hypothetical protein
MLPSLDNDKDNFPVDVPTLPVTVTVVASEVQVLALLRKTENEPIDCVLSKFPTTRVLPSLDIATEDPW